MTPEDLAGLLECGDSAQQIVDQLMVTDLGELVRAAGRNDINLEVVEIMIDAVLQEAEQEIQRATAAIGDNMGRISEALSHALARSEAKR